MEEIPAPLVTDSEDVTTALETAHALWKRDERGDAIAWVRRAARAAGEASDDDRAVWLARIAAELADQIAGRPKSDDELVIELEVEPPSRPSSADDVVTSAPPNALLTRPLAPAAPSAPAAPRKPPPPPPRRPPTVAPPAKPTSIPPPAASGPVASSAGSAPAASAPPRPATVAPPRPPPPARPASLAPPANARPAGPPPRPLPPPRPPIPTVDPDPMEETVTEWPPREGSEPGMSLPPVMPSFDQTLTPLPPADLGVPEPVEAIEETVTEWPPRSGGEPRPPSELPTRPDAVALGAGAFPTEAPTVARAPRASDLRPSSSMPSPAAEPEAPAPDASPVASPAPPAPPAAPAPPAPAAPAAAEAKAPPAGPPRPASKGTIPPPSKLSKSREPSAPVPIQIEGDILDEGEAPPTFRPPEPSRRQPTIVPRPEAREAPASEGPTPSEPEPQTRRMPVSPQLVAATAPASAGPAVDLSEVPELSDLPDDARERFATRGGRRSLRAGEKIEGFALALVLRGEADLVSPEGELVVERLRRGAVLRARGTEGPSQHVALVGALAGTEVICWDEASVDEALGDCPWVESELRSAADRRLCELGTMRGPLGARLDPDLRQQLFGVVQVKALAPGETLTHEGETVPTLAVVGTGSVELCKGGAVERVAVPGEILFGADVLRGARAPVSARAGSQGALVLLADKGRRAALFASFPSLLEILADM